MDKSIFQIKDLLDATNHTCKTTESLSCIVGSNCTLPHRNDFTLVIPQSWSMTSFPALLEFDWAIIKTKNGFNTFFQLNGLHEGYPYVNTSVNFYSPSQEEP